MAKIKLLNGIAHDVAHHAQSTLSWLHPHLGQTCRTAGISQVTVDLLCPEPYPEGLPLYEPLAKALVALRDWFLGLIERKGLSPTEVASLRLVFSFNPKEDDYSCSVRSHLVSRNGREFSREIL